MYQLYRKKSLEQLRVVLEETEKGIKMAKKYKYSYYVFDTKEDYDLFLELIKFHGYTGKYSGYDRNEIYYFVCAKLDPEAIKEKIIFE